ncbi:MAG: hypothetical protein AAF679_09375 [Pseudomonadota bacterium]
MAKTVVVPSVLSYGLVAFYGYGAAVHVANMLGWTGFDWSVAPLKWQVLDGIYLVLDLAIVAGLLARRGWAVPALVFAAISQILLYTLLRSWVLDVPAEFAVAPSELAYLNGLVGFHIACLAALGAVVTSHRRRAQT